MKEPMTCLYLASIEPQEAKLGQFDGVEAAICYEEVKN